MASHLYDVVPIDTSKREIRLIELLPGQDDDVINCIFHCRRLEDEAFEFAALSYTWGEQTTATCTIYIDGREFNARHNLWLFLKQERQNGIPRLLWIDAICIDQTRVMERNHQVGLMRDIYSKASCVTIWLGPAYEDSEIAINKLKRFPHRSSRKNFTPLWSHAQGNALLGLFSRRYWRRVWIVQEILLARRITIICGKDQFDWSCMEGFYKAINEIEDSRIHHHRLALQIQSSFAMRLCFQKQVWDNLPSTDRRLELFDLMAANHDFECTDIRDRVFGFLGLTLSRDDSDSLMPDYSISVDELYSRTLRYFNNRLEHSGSILAEGYELRKHAHLLRRILKLNRAESLVDKEVNLLLLQNNRRKKGTKQNIVASPHCTTRIFTPLSPAVGPSRSLSRVLLDSALISDLNGFVNRSLEMIHTKWSDLNRQAQITIRNQCHQAKAGQLIAEADAEIERYQGIIRDIDKLEVEWNTMQEIGKVAKHMRALSEFYDRII